MAGPSGVDPRACDAADWLALEIADIAADAARREAEDVALLAASILDRRPADRDELARRDEETAAALERAIEERARRTRARFPAPRKGWLADQISQRDRRSS